MLAKRIIPCLDVAGGRVVKGIKFQNIKDAGLPEILAARYAEEGADELAMYDITASIENRGIDLDCVRRVARAIDMPLSVGGGIRCLDDFTAALGAGADKVSINTAAIRNPELINQASRRFGAQCVVLSVDCMKENDRWQVMTGGGKVRENLDVLDWLEEAVGRGAGEVILNAISADGTRQGYDLDLLKAARKRVRIPIIASGGAGQIEHFAQAFCEADVDGVLAASIFHYDKIKIAEVKRQLKIKGVEVRTYEGVDSGSITGRT